MICHILGHMIAREYMNMGYGGDMQLIWARGSR